MRSAKILETFVVTQTDDQPTRRTDRSTTRQDSWDRKEGICTAQLVTFWCLPGKWKKKAEDLEHHLENVKSICPCFLNDLKLQLRSEMASTRCYNCHGHDFTHCEFWLQLLRVSHSGIPEEIPGQHQTCLAWCLNINYIWLKSIEKNAWDCSLPRYLVHLKVNLA